jgi:hypothetical protein
MQHASSSYPLAAFSASGSYANLRYDLRNQWGNQPPTSCRTPIPDDGIFAPEAFKQAGFPMENLYIHAA